MPTRTWSRDELILAFNLYCKTPFGRIHVRNPDIVALADILGRTPSAVSWKLANFARLDPELRARDISGASHGGSGEIQIWNEFNQDWDRLAFESERLLAEITGGHLPEIIKPDQDESFPDGVEREATVRVRVNQQFFRATVLAAYNFRCCITGLSLTELLTASHIVPWSVDAANRVNPSNGLCLNAIHDRAFDRGLLTITPEYTIKISPRVIGLPEDTIIYEFLSRYDGQHIALPQRFLPDKRFLQYHNLEVFKSL